MFVNYKIIDAAKGLISSSLALNNKTNWSIYGQFDITDKTGINMPCIKVLCFNEEPQYKESNLGLHKAELQILTFAYSLLGTNTGEGTTANEFETVSDMVINPFLNNSASVTLQNYTNNLQILNINENGLESTPLNDGWFANQKFEVVCSRTE